MAHMPAGPRRTPRADAARNASSLLAAAKELFDEHGPEVALDAVARRAGVGNATLYRHFPTRDDLLVAVYADEVAALCERGTALLDTPDALFTWLDDLVTHIATKRTLAHTATDTNNDRRTELFDHWHEAIRSVADQLLTHAQHTGAVRQDFTTNDMLALTSAIAVTTTDAARARELLQLMRHGFAGPGAA